MGQFYRVFVESSSKNEVFSPMNYGSFPKLMEHSWLLNGFVDVIARVIKNSPKKIAWVGDYAEPDDFLNIGTNPDILEICWGEKSKTVKNAEFQQGENAILCSGFLVNHSKRIYVDMKEYRRINEIDGWCTNPLPILTAVGNGRGAGDYHKKNDVGKWAFDLISWEEKKPKKYNKVLYQFPE